MLKTIRLHNFKSHHNTELELDGSRLYAIVGQNGAGKTSVLQAVYTLCQMADPKITYYVFQDELNLPSLITSKLLVKNRTYGLISKEDMMSVGVTGINDGVLWDAWYQWRRDTTNSTNGHKEDDWTPSEGWRIGGEETKVRGLDVAPSPISGELRHAVHLKFVASNLAKPGYSDEVAPQMDRDGTGLAPVIDYIRTESPEKFREIERLLSRIVPNLQGIIVKRAKVPVTRYRTIEADNRTFSYETIEEMIGQEIAFQLNRVEPIRANAMGEGTILALGLIAVLMSPNRPNIILLDDIEQGLHPKAQVELVIIFKEIIEANPDLQIIFTTHSPYILDELKPSQVHVLHQANKDDGTLAKRLDEHTSSSWAFDELTTGEFWDAEGEEWVLEEREKEVVVDG